MSDSVVALDLREPPRRHEWTDRQRQVVCLLRKYYDNSWNDLGKIFSELFKHQLGRHRYYDGMPGRILQAQWHTLRNKNSPIWSQIHSDSTLTTTQFAVIRDIVTVAETLAVSLQENRNSTNDQQTFSQDYSFAQSAPSPTSPPPVPSLKCNPDSRQPRLMFRFWSAESNGFNSPTHFVAGLWAHKKNVPPLDSDPCVVNGYAHVHLSRFKGDTPFISLFDTPLSPLHRALQKPDGMVTIFDMSSFDEARLISAVDVLKEKPLDPEIGKASLQLAMPEKFADELATKIARGWKFESFKPENVRLFLDGVHDGYRRKRPRPDDQALNTNEDWEMVDDPDNPDWETVDGLDDNNTDCEMYDIMNTEPTPEERPSNTRGPFSQDVSIVQEAPFNQQRQEGLLHRNRPLDQQQPFTREEVFDQDESIDQEGLLDQPQALDQEMKDVFAIRRERIAKIMGY
ncbi:predicted protein [Uncinocarpus reesii 1704]|uniref:DUF7587 domain-containing protein n=1 Tax=Uncinocarpus reesii (strain UAMH 1704) TaxID=336963 RepID=C4JFA7_UNCRE|nr:uncharacterized protein UREG_02329 [Uncinocarpus reesii 1704]EEP77480.1 predicted protein [Uncinocarpus reesii 1704]